MECLRNHSPKREDYIAAQLNPRLEAFLVNAEGERLTAYLCSDGHWTIGVGLSGLDLHGM
jgi:GH24 family phage-related lysozyme (muramidase)